MGDDHYMGGLGGGLDFARSAINIQTASGADRR
jgi:hypothetical protein